MKRSKKKASTKTHMSRNDEIKIAVAFSGGFRRLLASENPLAINEIWPSIQYTGSHKTLWDDRGWQFKVLLALTVAGSLEISGYEDRIAFKSKNPTILTAVLKKYEDGDMSDLLFLFSNFRLHSQKDVRELGAKASQILRDLAISLKERFPELEPLIEIEYLTKKTDLPLAISPTSIFSSLSPTRVGTAIPSISFNKRLWRPQETKTAEDQSVSLPEPASQGQLPEVLDEEDPFSEDFLSSAPGPVLEEDKISKAELEPFSGSIHVHPVLRNATDEELSRYKSVEDALLRLCENKTYTKKELFPDEYSYNRAERWQQDFLKKLIATGLVVSPGDKQSHRVYIGIKEKIENVISDNEWLIKLVFPSDYPRFLNPEPEPEPEPTSESPDEESSQSHSMGLPVPQGVHLDQDKIREILEYQPQFIQILEYHAERLAAVEKTQLSLDAKMDAIIQLLENLNKSIVKG